MNRPYVTSLEVYEKERSRANPVLVSEVEKQRKNLTSPVADMLMSDDLCDPMNNPNFRLSCLASHKNILDNNLRKFILFRK